MKKVRAFITKNGEFKIKDNNANICVVDMLNQIKHLILNKKQIRDSLIEISDKLKSMSKKEIDNLLDELNQKKLKKK